MGEKGIKGKKMVKGMKKIGSCILVSVILMCVMSGTVFAVDSGDNAAKASNVSVTSCTVSVAIDDDTCVGYKVYIDGVYQFTEGQGTTPDGFCSFSVTEGTHTLEIRKNGCSASKTHNFLCGVSYTWVSMPDYWCEGGGGDCDNPPTVYFDKTSYYEGDKVQITVSTIHSSVYYEIKDCSETVRKTGYTSGGTISYTIPDGSTSSCCYWTICFYWDEGGDPVGSLGAAGNINVESYQCTKCYNFYVCPDTCDAYVEIEDKVCFGYDVYVDGVHQFTEGQGKTPDGYCSFTVSEGYHTIKIQKDGCSETVYNNNYFQCNGQYKKILQTYWCDCNKPDLVIQDISWYPSNPDKGDTVTFTVTIKNQGSGSAGSSTVKYYIDGSYVASDSVPSLSAGSTSTQTFTWSADTCGNVQVKAVADANNAVSESEEENNYKTETVSVICDKPDLIVTSIIFNPNPANNGDNVIVSVTVKNQGTGDAGPHYEFLGYPDRYTLLKEWYCSGLNAGTSKTFTHTLEDVQHSDTYEACADWGQVVQESNENNNCLTAYLEVSEEKPDLVIQDISWDKSSPEQGDTVTFTVKVKNQGAGSAGSSTVKYYIDGSYVASDSVTSLSAGSTSTQTFTWTATKCGNVQVKAVADATNVVSESNEANNERTKTVKVDCVYEVKFRGKVLVNRPIISFYSIDIKIDEILNDPTGKLKVGDVVTAWSHRDSPAQIEDLVVGDIVEVFGNYFGYDVRAGVESDYIDLESANHYLKKEKKPDLIIQDISGSPSDPKNGDTVTFTVKTKNQGSGSADGFYVCYYVDGPYYDRDYVSSLSAGSTKTTSFSWTAESGSHTIKAIADCYDAITESNEGNNEKSIAIEIEEEIKFIGTLTTRVMPMGFTRYFFEVDRVLEGSIPVGDEVGVMVHASGVYPPLSNYDPLDIGDKAEVYAAFLKEQGKQYDPWVDREVWNADITGNEKYYVRAIPPPKTIYVDDDFEDNPAEHKWDTIQEGINDANDGDTILVYPGPYTENVDVTKSVTIKSTSGNPVDTIVQAAVSNQNYQSVITVTADNVYIDGFTIKGASYFWCSGIWLNGSHCVISNNTFVDNAVGVWIHPPSLGNNTIRNNNFSSSSEYSPSTAVYLEVSENIIYLNNFIIGIEWSDWSGNIWNSTKEITYAYKGNTFTNYLGNYWDDYEEKYPDAEEIDSSGIWDTAYSIDPDQDNYPLKERSENYVKQVRIINFSDHNWTVKSGYHKGPGPNHWLDSEENVWVDDKGLHLRITNRSGTWYCAEVVSEESFGYGKYTFYLDGRPDLFDKNVVLGLFTYLDIDGDDKIEVEEGDGEIDIEFSKWSNASSKNNSWYVLQYHNPEGERDPEKYQFLMVLNGNYSTHYFDWQSSSVDFKSIHGHYEDTDDPDYIIAKKTLEGSKVPTPSNEKVHINLWLYDGDEDGQGDAPSNDQEVEIIIKGFNFSAPEHITIGEMIEKLANNPDTTVDKEFVTDGFVYVTTHKVWKGVEILNDVLVTIEKAAIDPLPLPECIKTLIKELLNHISPARVWDYCFGMHCMLIMSISESDQIYDCLPCIQAYAEDDNLWPEPGSVVHIEGAWEKRSILWKNIGYIFRIEKVIVDESYTNFKDLADLGKNAEVKMMAVVAKERIHQDNTYHFLSSSKLDVYLKLPEGEQIPNLLLAEIHGMISDKSYIGEKLECTITVDNLKIILADHDAQLQSPDRSKESIIIDCPVNATITDQYDRTIADDGTNEIPNASMIVTNETKIFYLPADLTYSTEIDAYDTGIFNFTRVSPIGNDITITKFENIPVISSTKASVEIVPDETNYTMSIDYDGDGVYEIIISPDVNETIIVSPSEENIFDTRASTNPYPSLSGTHAGTITPTQNITVQKLYTYPCAGTGGHTEYVRIYGNGKDESASWTGYAEEWHTLTFDSSFTLEGGKTYNYVIKTGSYPQIHHTPALQTETGWINCTEFADANGNEYDDRIPALRLFF